MSDIKNPTKQKLEHLLNMKTGYVLDFNNAGPRPFSVNTAPDWSRMSAAASRNKRAKSRRWRGCTPRNGRPVV
jgi:hypothetical protein